MSVDLTLELFFGHLPGFVQPGCTVELLAISPGYLHQFSGFCPSHQLQISFGDSWQVLVDRHQQQRFLASGVVLWSRLH